MTLWTNGQSKQANCCKMELQTYLNELSCDPSPFSAEEARERIKVLMGLLRALYSIGIKHFRISDDKYVCWELYPGCTLQEIIKETKNKAYIDFFYAIFTAPFLDDDAKTKVEKNKTVLLRDDNEILCVGLAAAYFTKTFAISFDSDTFWHSVEYTIKVNNKEEKVIALCKEDNLKTPVFAQWQAKTCPPEIPTTKLKPNEKKFNLCGDHHGKKELKQLWDRLKHKHYIIECICSLPFDSKTTDPIAKVYDDGTIDFVDITSDSGYAMRIRTTATDKFQTQRIADMIRKWIN